MLRRATVAVLACAALALPACDAPTGDPAAGFHAGFMDGCTRKGTPQPMCQCFYDKLVARYAPEEAMRRVKSGQLTREEMVRLAQPCLGGSAA